MVFCTCLKDPSDPIHGQAVQFKRLGYLSLDSNERSQFQDILACFCEHVGNGHSTCLHGQARELKSVYVDVVAQFLRILFHKCMPQHVHLLHGQ